MLQYADFDKCRDLKLKVVLVSAFSHVALMDSSFFVFRWQDSEGMLDFLPGERLKFITVTIIDNPVPELDKIFRVELYNADGGG